MGKKQNKHIFNFEETKGVILQSSQQEILNN